MFLGPDKLAMHRRKLKLRENVTLAVGIKHGISRTKYYLDQKIIEKDEMSL